MQTSDDIPRSDFCLQADLALDQFDVAVEAEFELCDAVIQAAQRRKEALRLAQANVRKAVRPVAGLPPLPKLPDDDAAGLSRVLQICAPEQKAA